MLILDTGMRVGEARLLEGKHVRLDPAGSARFGYLRVAVGKTKAAQRNLSLTGRVGEILRSRIAKYKTGYLFPSDSGDAMMRNLVESLTYEDTGSAQATKRLRDTLVTSYDVDPPWRIKYRRVYDHEDRGSQQHHGVARVRSPVSRVT